MTTERAERRPNTPLFPLSPSSIGMAHGSPRYVDRAKDPQSLMAYIQEVHDRTSGNLNVFLDRMTLQIPDYSSDRGPYRYGTTFILDGINLERAQLRLPPVRVKRVDIEVYEEIRRQMVGDGWYSLDNGSLQRLILAVNSRLESEEPDLRPIMDTYIEAVMDEMTPRQMLRWKNAFLIGMADAYFPNRFAYDRERA